MVRPSATNAQIPAFGHLNFDLSLFLIALLMGIEISEERIGGLRRRIALMPVGVRWAAYYALCVAILAFGIFAGRQAFIYFQF
jgi:hypothetical protein